MNQRTWKFVLAAFMAGSAAAAPAAAQAAETVFVDINHSQNLHVAGGISRVAVANPEIADVNVLSGRDLLVVAKKAGATTLFVWGSNGARYDYIVSVSGEDSAGSASIQHLIGYPNVKVDKIGNQILLTGRVQNQDEKQRAESIASMYSEKVVNMLEMVHPLQVRIQAQIIEVNRGKTKDLGIDWGNASSIDSDTGIVTVNSGSFSFGQNASNSKVGSVFGKLGTYAGINATLSAMIQNNDAKILSQPHMITMSGTKASILVGGQMPVPTTNSNGSSNVEWKNYGIELDIEPVADPDGNIPCKVKASVSTLSSDAGSTINGTTLKGLVSREATSEISLASGGHHDHRRTSQLGGQQKYVQNTPSGRSAHYRTVFPFRLCLPYGERTAHPDYTDSGGYNVIHPRDGAHEGRAGSCRESGTGPSCRFSHESGFFRIGGYGGSCFSSRAESRKTPLAEGAGKIHFLTKLKRVWSLRRTAIYGRTGR